MTKTNGKRIWNTITTLVVVVVVLCAAFLMGSRIMGYRVYTVISGSMEPTYGVGDLIYVQKVDPKDVREGDPITFVMNENLVVATHRVVRIDSEKQHFYTKGDANEIEDSAPVHFNNLIGIPRFKIPKLGYVSDFIQRPPGMYIAIVMIGVLLLVTFFPSRKPRETEAGKATGTTEAVGTDAPNVPPREDPPAGGADSAPPAN